MISCVAKRTLDAEQSIFKIDIGKSISWRAGFNSWAKELSVEREKFGVSQEMHTEI